MALGVRSVTTFWNDALWDTIEFGDNYAPFQDERVKELRSTRTRVVGSVYAVRWYRSSAALSVVRSNDSQSVDFLTGK